MIVFTDTRYTEDCRGYHVSFLSLNSSGSSGRVRGGAEKHEIYAAAFGGHLFYDLFSQGQGGGHGPLGPPWIRYCLRSTNQPK